MHSTNPSKPELREQMRHLLRNISREELTRASDTICHHAARQIRLHDNLHTIAIYAAHGTEVSLFPLHQLLPDKKLLYPLCHPKNKLSFHHVPNPSELIPGMLGIPEPVPSIHEQCPITEIDLILCPGLAFDQNGNRLGHGGGYYDRILNQHTGPTWGIALQKQLLPHIPHEKHDIPVDTVITESGMTGNESPKK